MLAKNWNAVLCVLIIFIFSLTQLKSWTYNQMNKPVYQFTSDVAIYYSYLPAFFKNDDIKFQKQSQPQAGLEQLENGNRIPKYTFGMAILYSPFYLLAELFSSDESDYAKFGLTRTHSLFNRIGTLLFVCLGFYLLINVLNSYFSKFASLMASLLIFFGTNLTHYTILEGAFPHSYLFTLFSAIIFLSDRYWKTQNNRDLYLLAFLCGLVFLTRASEAIIITIPFFWAVYNIDDLKNRIIVLLSKWKVLTIALLLFLIPILPYLYYMKIMTGDYFFYAYGNERFYFLEPKFWDFLFSFRKGWMIYTPLMIFASLAFFMKMKNGKKVPPVIFFTILITIYVMSSWWCWWFGGSFGNRSMIQYYSLMAFPLAALIDWMMKKRVRAIALSVLLLSSSAYSYWMTRKYHRTEIHWDSMSYESFKYTVSRISFKSVEDYEEMEKLLIPPHYGKAKEGGKWRD